MELSLTGHRVLVVGASGGIGQEIANSLDAEGARLAVTATSAESVAGPGHAIALDLTDSASVESGVADAVEHLGGLDALVVSAAHSAFGSLWESGREHLRRQLEVKYVGVADLCKAAASHMEDGGSIVLLTGIAAEIPFGGNPAGGAANAALTHLTKLLAMELAHRRIRVVAVSPGFTRTSRFDSFSGNQIASIEESIPLGRIAEPAEIASVVTFLISPRANYITGTTVVVDGGRSLTGTPPVRQEGEP